MDKYEYIYDIIYNKINTIDININWYFIFQETKPSPMYILF